MQTVVVLEEHEQHPDLPEALADLGYSVLAQLTDPRALCTNVARLAPDVIIVTAETPGERTLMELRAVAETCARPVVLFANHGSRAVIRKAVECGVAAYVVDGFAPERLMPIIEAAAARFDAFEAVRRELDTTRNKLSERKVIEKAKGIVMEQRKLSEDEAYGALRKMAMDQNLALAEIARRVISVSRLLA